LKKREKGAFFIFWGIGGFSVVFHGKKTNFAIILTYKALALCRASRGRVK
jgi:hypothetical protein